MTCLLMVAMARQTIQSDCGFLLGLGRGEEREKLIFHNHRSVYEHTRESGMREKRDAKVCVCFPLCPIHKKKQKNVTC